MKKPIVPTNEDARLESLFSYDVLDTLPEEEYDAITKIASEICDTPIALISLVDPERQWFKSHHGLDSNQTSRDVAFCAHAINQPDELFIIPDASKDERFFDNPITKGDPNVIFYAGAPLNTADGNTLGTLCVIDNKPRKNLTQGQQDSLKALAKQVMVLLELRKKNAKLKKANKEVLRLNDQLNHFAYRLTHDLKTPIRGINSLIDFLKEDYNTIFKDSKAKEWIDLISSRAVYMDTLIEEILAYTKVTNEEIKFSKFNIKELIETISNNSDIDYPFNIEMIGMDKIIEHSKIGLVQVFQNLISNSKKFNNKEKCIIKIKMDVTNDSYNFTFEDNGPGIPEKYWEKIFVMFETLDDANAENTGIGLATVRSIVQRLGGNIVLENKKVDESGVCFKFNIAIKNLNN
ncbi:GAF sensor signal transduction histidine kinase [Lutibacter sp. Hel_I_33_5]|uniref:sensor histidine kinase n=1 Tax=Lutibacter sp. Hel_I_33_5 TaxID=1566289 RepID=UPI0011A72D74|nr:ATP-binding protein [Lutibacter sp. Hel_I_33_5]TVZ54880.1 GAF sensor signal transduction histidine kinase [Lutibacter sp. Hel_I_33_5]